MLPHTSPRLKPFVLFQRDARVVTTLKSNHTKQIKRTNVTASRVFLKTSPLYAENS